MKILIAYDGSERADKGIDNLSADAQQRIVQMILPENRLSEIKLLRRVPDERLGTTD